MLRVVGVVIVLVIFVYALVDVIRTDGRLTRGISKPAWIIVQIVLPLLGAILWFIFGRPYNKPTAKPVRRQPTAPDDDPEFLRNLETRRRKQAEDDRLKKLKAEHDAKQRGDKPSDADGDAKGNGFKPGDAKRSEPDPHDTDELK
ncbi:PLD nuclease N-terminal domain-containing protein [Paenarthrobacter aurescens]|uniref:PLD nuclease N-terminal domain-containing protein n=1 Tax=Paenarthrobacter aurescens TaxID=43663 RepID=UPI0021BFB03A|nr:PLD nuclease N-terminal domain-containing protein [Paenarthrobacter aurescens]MCT9869076.1 PLD nuclease N-terminal domain-containing protein [Paenarthrobacter aurescens]